MKTCVNLSSSQWSLRVGGKPPGCRKVSTLEHEYLYNYFISEFKLDQTACPYPIKDSNKDLIFCYSFLQCIYCYLIYETD